MKDTIILSMEDFQRAIREANDMGHYGIRVIAAYVVNGTAASGSPSFAWDTDRGHTSATKSWEDR
jgi:hypothetical protein